MNRTQIEWVRNPDGTPGYTSNPFTGCLKRCAYCYAWRESLGRCRLADLRGQCIIERGHEDDPFYPRFHPDRLTEIRRRQTPAGIFLCNRSDWCAPYWPTGWASALWFTLTRARQHRFYLLTKQPQELRRFTPFPAHCWVGVTATDSAMAEQAVFHLRRIEAAVRFISFEPLDSDISLDLTGVDWGIIGQQTHPDRSPLSRWVYSLVDCLDRAGAHVFVKNNLGYLYDAEAFPLRQEMPR